MTLNLNTILWVNIADNQDFSFLVVILMCRFLKPKFTFIA